MIFQFLRLLVKKGEAAGEVESVRRFVANEKIASAILVTRSRHGEYSVIGNTEDCESFITGSNPVIRPKFSGLLRYYEVYWRCYGDENSFD